MSSARRLSGRLAPSPTGLLHVGHARSFLIAWWSIRAAGGSLSLRLEDLDRTRVRPEYVDRVLSDLEWLGLDWDGPVLSQFEGRAALHDAAHDLLQRGLAYPCVCTRREIQDAIAAPHAGEATEVYPGTCRGLYASLADAREASGREPALRLRVEAGEVSFVDLLHGEQRADVARTVGDFPLTSRDGQVAYQLAVVVDDAREGVTEVLRGDDLLDSTARQLLLQRALGLPSPRWGHLGLVVDASGRRLAKRADDLSLARLRELQVDPRLLVSWIAVSAGMTAETGTCVETQARTASELIPDFQLRNHPEPAVRFDRPELDSLVSGRVPRVFDSPGDEKS